MTNAIKGGVPFHADGTPYTLIYSTNALCVLESTMGRSVSMALDLLADPAKARVSDVRTLFWAGLQDQHPDLSQPDAGRIMDALGIMPTLDLMMRAVALAFPPAKVGAENSRPLANATHAGTGMVS